MLSKHRHKWNFDKKTKDWQKKERKTTSTVQCVIESKRKENKEEILTRTKQKRKTKTQGKTQKKLKLIFFFSSLYLKLKHRINTKNGWCSTTKTWYHDSWYMLVSLRYKIRWYKLHLAIFFFFAFMFFVFILIFEAKLL